jgi:N-acetylneuraminate lyase
MSEHIKGLIAAPLTGFHSDGSVNYEVISEYIKFLHFNNVAGVFVNGTSGEGMSLSSAERMTIAERWTILSPPGLKIIIHVGHTSHTVSKSLAAHAEEIGATAIGEIGPIFFKPTSVESLIEYSVATAASAGSLPYYYYHMPSMSGVDFSMYDFLQAAHERIPNLAGIKFTSENLMEFTLCQEFDNGTYDILFGRDELLLCGLALGAQGAVGSTYNFIAPLYHGIIEAFESLNLLEARRLQFLSIQVIQILLRTGSFLSAAKAVMKMLGLDLGIVRPPLQSISCAKVTELKSDLEKVGFFEFCSKRTKK